MRTTLKIFQLNKDLVVVIDQMSFPWDMVVENSWEKGKLSHINRDQNPHIVKNVFFYRTAVGRVWDSSFSYCLEECKCGLTTQFREIVLVQNTAM